MYRRYAWQDAEELGEYLDGLLGMWLEALNMRAVYVACSTEGYYHENLMVYCLD